MALPDSALGCSPKLSGSYAYGRHMSPPSWLHGILQSDVRAVFANYQLIDWLCVCHQTAFTFGFYLVTVRENHLLDGEAFRPQYTPITGIADHTAFSSTIGQKPVNICQVILKTAYAVFLLWFTASVEVYAMIKMTLIKREG